MTEHEDDKAVRDLLVRAAHVPTGQVDYPALERDVRAVRRRRRGVALGTGAVSACMVLTAALVLGLNTSLAPDAPAGSSPAWPTGLHGEPYTGNRLLVQVSESDGLQSADLTVPDGSSYEITVPVATGLDQMAATPYWAARLGPDGPSRDFHLPPGGRSWFTSIGTEEREVLRTDDAVVTLWDVTDRTAGPGRYLVFGFGAYVLGVWDGAGGSQMSDDELSAWAAGLTGQVTDDGYLVLDAAAPLTFEDSGAPAALLLTAPQRGDEVPAGVSVRAEPCTTPRTDLSPGLAVRCEPEWGVTVQISDGDGGGDGLAEFLSSRLTVTPPAVGHRRRRGVAALAQASHQRRTATSERLSTSTLCGRWNQTNSGRGSPRPDGGSCRGPSPRCERRTRRSVRHRDRGTARRSRRLRATGSGGASRGFRRPAGVRCVARAAAGDQPRGSGPRAEVCARERRGVRPHRA